MTPNAEPDAELLGIFEVPSFSPYQLTFARAEFTDGATRRSYPAVFTAPVVTKLCELSELAN